MIAYWLFFTRPEQSHGYKASLLLCFMASYEIQMDSVGTIGQGDEGSSASIQNCRHYAKSTTIVADCSGDGLKIVIYEPVASLKAKGKKIEASSFCK
jgi:hypothetical protein